jgi:transcriptional regulator with XRE-family HTH domain
MAQNVIDGKRLDVGEKIRAARKARHMSTTKLAIEVGVDPRTVARWQANGTRPSYERLLKLAEVLGRSPSYFLDGEDV